jgi:hypothetical protein
VLLEMLVQMVYQVQMAAMVVITAQAQVVAQVVQFQQLQL